MKRYILIGASALLLLAALGISLLAYMKPEMIFAAKAPDSEPASVPAAKAELTAEQIETRNRARSLIQQLGLVQDRIVRGDRSALSEQSKLLIDIAGAIRRFGDRDWQDEVNLRTSFLYVLSGGQATVLRRFLDETAENEADQKLARGILRFAQGQPKAARKLFQDIDPRSLDVSLVGPFALARASLYMEQSTEKAIELLDEARLASPHTAIEEAAVRREIPMLMSSGDVTRGLMHVADYMRRFGKSLYAPKLFHDFAESFAKSAGADDPTAVPAILDNVEGSDGQAITDLMLSVAGSALLHGKLATAKASANAVLKLAKGSADDLQKARLYVAAADAPSTDAGSALQVLDQIADESLSDDEAQIREVAGYIARVIVESDAIIPPTDKMSGKPGEPARDLSSTPPSVTGALGNADAALKEADLITSGMSQ